MAVSTRSTTGAPQRDVNGWLRGRITRVSVPLSATGPPSGVLTMSDEAALSRFRTAWWQRLLDNASTYALTRFAVLRMLGLVYFAAFGSLALQLDPLLGAHGLLPVPGYLAFSLTRLGSEAYWRIPTL